MDIKSKEIKIVPIEQIIPNPKNTNTHPEEQIERLIKILNYQGFREPLIISNRSGFLVCGHGRLEAAKKMGLTELPCIYQDFENEAQEFSHMTADNEIARWAELDTKTLMAELDKIELPDLDFLGLKKIVIDGEVKTEKDEDKKTGSNEPFFAIVLPFDNAIDMADIVSELEIRNIDFKTIDQKSKLKVLKKWLEPKEEKSGDE